MNVPDDFTQTELDTGTWWRHLVAGALAGAVSRTATAPLDRLKVYLQVQASKQRISDTFKYLLKEGGWFSLWRGNGINVIKIAPESAIKFMAYEQVKRYIRGQEQNRPMSIFERFVGTYLLFTYIAFSLITFSFVTISFYYSWSVCWLYSTNNHLSYGSAENSTGSSEDWRVCGYVRLCEENLCLRRPSEFLSRLCAKHNGRDSLLWH